MTTLLGYKLESRDDGNYGAIDLSLAALGEGSISFKTAPVSGAAGVAE